jgi:hypothetical protein
MSTANVGTALVTRKRSGTWDRSSGVFEQVVYEGTKHAIDGLAPGLRLDPQAGSYDYDHDGGLSRLVLRRSAGPDGNEVQNEIRYEAHRISKSLFDLNPAGLSRSQLKAVKEAVEANDDPDDSWNHDQLELYTLGIEDGAYAVIYQPVIIRTSSAAPGYAWQPNYALTGAIIAPDSILKVVNAGVPFDLPNDSTFDDERKAYGWLQNHPEYVEAFGGKAHFSVTWEYGLWARYTYGDPVQV